MEERKMYRFRVSHTVHGEAEIVASDRYFAVTGAAKEWGVRWSTIARDCRVKKLGDAPPVKVHRSQGTPTGAARPRNDSKAGKEGTARGKADKKRQRNP